MSELDPPEGRPVFSLIDWSVNFHIERCDGPFVYNKWLAMLLIGNGMGYHTVNRIQPGAVHHNLYLLITGKSAVTRKSTSQNLAMLELAVRTMTLPKEFSPEAFVEAVAEHPDGILALGELGYLLEKVRYGGYMAGIMSILNELYMCPAFYDRKLRKLYICIENAHLSVVSTITPDTLIETLDAKMIRSGMFPRWTLIHAKGHPLARKRLGEEDILFSWIFKEGLKLLLRLFKNGATFLLTNEALAHYNKIETRLREKYSDIPAFVERYLETIIKVADILLVSDAIGVELEKELDKQEAVEGELELTYLTTLTNLTTLTFLTALSKKYPIEDMVNVDKWGKSVKTVKTLRRMTKLVGRLAPVRVDIAQIPVPAYYIEEARKLIEPCLDYARIVNDSVQSEKGLRKVRKLINELEFPHELSHCLQLSHLKAREFNECINTCVQAGELIAWKIPKGRAWCCIPPTKKTKKKCKSCELKEHCPKGGD